MDIVPYTERCDFCHKKKFTKLCDFVDGHTWTSIDFRQVPNTCDRKICDECAVNLGNDFDFCPKHAEIARKKLGMR